MKNIYIAGFVLLSLVSCTDLTSESYDVINPGIFPKTEADAEALITASAYGPFRSTVWNGGIFDVASGIQTVSDMTTDASDCQWNDPVWAYILPQAFTPNSDWITKFYGYRADMSRMTNTFDLIAGVPMPDDVKARMNAELHCGLGWLAFLLYDLYGPIPVATKEQLANPMSDEVIPRPTKEWMVNYIEAELNEALKGLPAVYNASSADYGRFSKGLVYTILMKLYMHEGNWTKAEEMGRELMKPEYGYGLEPVYKDVFTLENERNREIIWACIETRSTNMQMWLAHVLSSEYPTKNENIQKWGGFRVPWAFYDTFDKENDKRLEVLIGDFIGTDGVHYNKENRGTVLFKGAMPIKYGEDPVATGEESQVDWIIYRYADVVTLLSEAIVRKNNAITQEAVDLLNMIRNRAGITPYSLSSFSSVQDFYDKILVNRGQELWFEGHRKADLIRHGKYTEFAIKYKGSTTAKEHFVLWPLPQSAINEGMGKIIQNPGY